MFFGRHMLFLLFQFVPLIRLANAQQAGLGTWSSQYGQDQFIFDRYFAVAANDEQQARKGVFVELGAADGVDKSNTLFFEQRLGWTGVLIEPNRGLFERLAQNRPESKCVHACVARVAGFYSFSEDGLNSGFTAHRGDEILKGSETGGGLPRHCRTLTSILDEHLGSTAHIDYMSLDLEGGELDVLQSFDFSRHTVDVMSIEAPDWRPDGDRIARLLTQRGFRFVERLVMDEIWVRRRGSLQDPGCLHPGVRVEDSFQRQDGAIGPRGGWDAVRETLWKLLQVLQATWYQGVESTSAFSMDLNASLTDAFRVWEDPEHARWEEECPPAMLLLAIAAALVLNRNTGQFMEVSGVTHDLRMQTLFHPSSRVLSYGRAYGLEYHNHVEAAERNGEQILVKIPLGRPWHEISFADVMESGWPLFGFLDLVVRVASSNFIYERISIHGTGYNVPFRRPRLLCQLGTQSDSEDSQLKMLAHRRKGRGTNPATSDLTFDTDACSLLGIAASQFHATRVYVLKWLKMKPVKDQYIGLANWTTACHRPGLGLEHAKAIDQCKAASHETCAALANGWQIVPRNCLIAIRNSPGSSLQLRRKQRFVTWKAALWLDHGERLFREFVRRHGLHSAMVTFGQEEMLVNSEALDGGRAETVFKALHDMQAQWLWSEGLIHQLVDKKVRSN